MCKKLEVPLSDEYLRAIGRITVNFAVLERGISSCVESLISSDPKLGHIITAGLSFRSLLDLLSSLYKYRNDNPNAITKLDKLIAQIARTGQKRDIITHSFWVIDFPGDEREEKIRGKITAKRNKGLMFQVEKVSVEELNKIADEIAEVLYEVNEYFGGWEYEFL